MMKSSFGTNINYTIFGESHGHAVGITIQGLPVNRSIDFNLVDSALLRRNGGASFNTPRQEKVEYDIVSGYFNDKTTGTPLTVLFYNKNTISKDYAHLCDIPRPGHADYVANKKYQGAQDYRGGGHFSARITTPIVFIGEIVRQFIISKYPDYGVYTHINKFLDTQDISYYKQRISIVNSLLNKYELNKIEELITLNNEKQLQFITDLKYKFSEFKDLIENMDQEWPLINNNLKSYMFQQALKIKDEQDSAGGQLEVIVLNCPHSIGEPYFNSVESVLSSLMYSIPSVKGVTFGYEYFNSAKGFSLSDSIISYDEINEQILTPFNYNAGINGGITNGEDIVLRVDLKPIASIQKEQITYNFKTKKIENLLINGRHDVTVINRVIPIIEAMINLGLYDLMLQEGVI